MKFLELQDQLREKFGIDRLADMARELDVSPQAVSNWKARDQVPYKYVLKIRRQLQESDTQVSTRIKNNTSGSNQILPLYENPQYLKEDTISLANLILVLARQLKIIIITPTIICTLTIIYALFFTSPVYESSTKIMSSSAGSGQISTGGGLAAQLGINFPSIQSEQEWMYTDIIKSRTLARAMLKRKFNTEKFGPQKSLLQILTYGDQKPTIGLDTLIKQGVEAAIGMINIQKELLFYNLTISAFEPLFARDFAIALIEELDSHQRLYNKTKTSETRQFIEERIVDTEKDLRGAEEALKNFRDRNRRIENSPALQLGQQRLSREVVVLTGVFTTLKQQLENTKIEEVKDSDYVVVLDPPEAPIQRSKPNRTLMVVLAGVLGLGLGTLIGFVKEYDEKTDKDDQEKLGQAKSLIIKNITDFLPRRFKK